MNNTFIPVYLKLKSEGLVRSERFASSVLNIILFANIFLFLLCLLFPKQIVFLFAPGLEGNISNTAVQFTRIMLPTIAISDLSLVVRALSQANNSLIGSSIMGILNHMIVLVTWYLEAHGILEILYMPPQ